jgi:hypothetical protein
VVLDAFSRRVIGWALGRTLEASLAVAALRIAPIERNPPPGLVHHSDRGAQYASLDYTEMLKQHQAAISMSRKGNPYDNAACESFMKTLKYEEVYRNEYRDFHVPAPASVSSWSASIIRNDFIPLSGMFRQPSSKTARCNEPGLPLSNGGSAPATLGFNAVAPEYRFCRAADAAPAIPATESTLGSHPCVALSSAQILPEWINRNLADNAFASNGDSPLNFVSRSRGSLQESSVMDERIRFVIRLKDGESMAALCREFGISRKTGYKIVDPMRNADWRGSRIVPGAPTAMPTNCPSKSKRPS